MKRKLSRIFKRLHTAFGAQHWWPADSAFEVIIGAILTQNTSWGNVQKAIIALKEKKLLTPQKLYRLKPKKLAALIRSSGYHNLKASRIKNFLKFFFAVYAAEIKGMVKADPEALRAQLLEVNGIGQETADSILLYALNRPVFVVDSYARRILLRHALIEEEASYSQVQDIFMRNLKQDAQLFNEYHALLVKLAKDYCHKKDPKCGICPLHGQ